MNFNKVILGGNLTRDPELRYGQSGKAYVKFGVAVNDTYTSADGEKKQSTVFVDLTAFGLCAETIAKYLKKGDPILVEGKLDYSTWVDKTTGANRNKLAVIVNSFQFVGSKREAGDAAPEAPTDSDVVPF